MNETDMELQEMIGAGARRARVGILGGGQLARMLAESAWRMGFRPITLALSAEDPAAQICPDSVYGSLTDPIALRRFLSQVDTVVFENEFVDCELLSQMSEGLSVTFAPSLEVLFQLQDKIRQKEILTKLGIESSRYLVHSKKADLKKWLQQVQEEFPNGFVLKWAQLGYDGKGTWISPEGTKNFSGDALKFCEAAVAKGVPLFAEEKVPIKREVAVVGVYSTDREFAAYPLVISQQVTGICRLVTGPAQALGVNADLEKKAHQAARSLAESISLYGSFAIEFFETFDGKLLVNEIAPRVHNTGHYTQNAADTSQFENHWRAVLGLGLGEVSTTPGFAMLNLLGPLNSNDKQSVASTPLRLSPHIHLHWYGKSEIRAGRKLGHLNGVVSSVGEISGLVRELEKLEQSWWR